MAERVQQTSYRPEKPLLVWEGGCGFCHYWAIRWERMTGDAVEYRPHTQALEEITDIAELEFKRSVKFIEPDGTVYHAAEAVYRSLTYAGGWKSAYQLYRSSGLFRRISEGLYRLVANNRPLLYDLTIAMFGKDPARPRRYWLIYLCSIILLSVALITVL